MAGEEDGCLEDLAKTPETLLDHDSTHLWREAAQWLVAVGALDTKRHSASIGVNAQPYDLEMIMRDGAALCKCVEILSKAPLEYREKPRSQAHMLGNIEAFIEAARERLKVVAEFSATDFFKGGDAELVTTFVNDLSMTVEAMDLGFDMLSEMAPVKAIKDTIDYTSAAHTCLTYQIEEKDLAGGDDGVEYMTTADRNDPRNRVLEELVVTERQYGEALTMLREKFQDKMHAQGAKLVSADDQDTLFGDIDNLMDAHVRFKAGLDRQMKASTGRNVSAAFLAAVEPFRCYARVCCQIQAGMKVYDKLFAQPDTKALLEKCRAESGQMFSLRELLNVPMQRILKYPLLLKQLFRGTPVDHPDKQGLGRALGAVLELAQWINDTKTSYDRVVDIAASIDGYPSDKAYLPSLGYLHTRGMMTHTVDGAVDGKAVHPHALLLSTCMVFTTPAKGGRFKYVGTLPLSKDTVVEDVDEQSPPKSKCQSTALSLVSEGKVHKLWFGNDDFRVTWKAAIGKVVNNLAQAAQAEAIAAELDAADEVDLDDAAGDDAPDEADGSVAKPYVEFTPKNLKVPMKKNAAQRINKKAPYTMFTPKRRQPKDAAK